MEKEKDVAKTKALCAECGKHNEDTINNGNNFKRCSNSKLVNYCCKQCQKNDWKEHKTFCNILKNIYLKRNVETKKIMVYI